MEYGLHIEERPSGIRVLTLSSPRKRNALDPFLLERLREALSPAGVTSRALLVRGAGDKSFCSGYDVESLHRVEDGEAMPDELLGEVCGLLERYPAPSVALIRGAAFGAGCELAASCDFRVGAEDALFCMPPARLGVIYAPEGLYRLMALVGRSRAKMMFLTGRRVAASQALAWGLLDELHSLTEAEAAALRLCEELAQNAPLAVQGMKRSFTLLAQPSLSPGERQEIHALRRAAYQSLDVEEGFKAFLEKRSPRFQGQ